MTSCLMWEGGKWKILGKAEGAWRNSGICLERQAVEGGEDIPTSLTSSPPSGDRKRRRNDWL